MVQRVGDLAHKFERPGDFPWRSRTPVMSCVLTVEVWREDRMDRTTVHMTGIPMPMVGLRMQVDQRNNQHPQNQPGESECA